MIDDVAAAAVSLYAILWYDLVQGSENIGQEMEKELGLILSRVRMVCNLAVVDFQGSYFILSLFSYILRL